MSTQAPTRPTPINRASATTSQMTLDLTPRKARPVCPRIVYYAVEKFGKTTALARAEKPVLLMARGETGYDTLLSSGSVPAVPAMVMESHEQLLKTLDALIADPKDRKTVGLDAMGGFDQLAQELVCARDFGNDWSNPRDGFYAFGAERGYKATANEWLKVLARLDALNARGIVTVLLGHAVVKTTKNPMGADYDTFTPDLNKHSWAATARWSDCILFGKFHSIVETGKLQEKKNISERKGKGIGGTQRVVYAAGCDAFVAGNRYGMPSEIELTDEPSQTWAQVWSAIVGKES